MVMQVKQNTIVKNLTTVQRHIYLIYMIETIRLFFTIKNVSCSPLELDLRSNQTKIMKIVFQTFLP